MRESIAAIAVLAIATLGGCSIPPASTPIENPDRHFEYEGFRFLPPAGAGWGVFRSSESSTPLNMMKDLGKSPRTVFAIAQVAIVPEAELKGKSPGEVLEFVANSMIATQLAQDKDKQRFTLVARKSIPPHNGGRSCIAWEFAFDDRGVPGAGGKLYRLAGESIACHHPDDISQVMVLDHSERFEASGDPLAYLEEGRRFLRSLDFLPLRYRVSSWKIGTSLQIPIHAHGSLWISDSKDNAVHILNPRAPEVPGRVAVGRNPIGLLELSAGVAVAHAGDGMVYLMDPTGKVVKTVNVGGHPVGFGNFGVVVAVCNAPDGKVSLLDAATLSVTREILVTDGRMSIYWCNAVGTELWTSSGVGGLGHIARVDPSQGKLISRIMFQPGATRQMLVHDQRVWIAFPDKGAVHVLDAASRDKVFDIPAGNYPVGIADFDGAMWVSALRGGSLQRFDPGSGARIGHPLLLGQGVGAMTVADGSLWIANALTGSLVRVTPRGP